MRAYVKKIFIGEYFNYVHDTCTLVACFLNIYTVMERFYVYK